MTEHSLKKDKQKWKVNKQNKTPKHIGGGAYF